jgi:HlyD family secretion protein
MKKSWLLLLIPIVLIGWYIWGRADSATVIHFAPVQQTTIESTVPTNGKVEPAEWAAARAETAGVVKSIQVQRGEAVQAGQTLITIDAVTAASELAGALARRQEAQAEASMVTGGGKAAAVASLDDQLTAAKATVEMDQRNFDSLSRLADKQAATKVQVQEAKDALQHAKLQVIAIQDQRKTLVTASDRTMALARVNSAQAAVDLAQQRMAYGIVRSPATGTLYQFDLKPGAYLQPGDLIGLVGNLNQVKVIVYVDEPDLGRVRLGMPVNITWDAQPGRKWTGRVDKLPTQIVSLGARTVGEVSTVVDNPNHDLLPGVSVNATIISKVVTLALSVPKAALHSMRGQTGVYKLNGRSIAWTPVSTGVSDVNNVQVESGLQLSDKVADRVIDPSDAELKDGLRVKAQFN